MSINVFSRWRHVSTGNIYTVLGIGNAKTGFDWARSVFYRSDETGELYARPFSEWTDRFAPEPPR